MYKEKTDDGYVIRWGDCESIIDWRYYEEKEAGGLL